MQPYINILCGIVETKNMKIKHVAIQNTIQLQALGLQFGVYGRGQQQSQNKISSTHIIIIQIFLNNGSTKYLQPSFNKVHFTDFSEQNSKTLSTCTAITKRHQILCQNNLNTKRIMPNAPLKLKNTLIGEDRIKNADSQ